MGKKEKRLIGIKAIARYLDMSVRNVYYWEKNLGLPIHRVSGHTGYRIYAYKEEIDNWMQDKDIEALERTKHKYKKILLPVIISIFVLIFILLSFQFILLLRSGGVESTGPELYTVDKNIIYVRNSKGDILWNFASKNSVMESDLEYILDIENIDDDTPKELIACTYNIQKCKFFITLFDHDGRIIWNRGVIPQHTFNKVTIEDDFRSSPAKFARSNTNEIFIISKWNHGQRFLSIITCHDLKGNLVSQYYHVGNLTYTLELIDLDGDGVDEIVFTGTNNLLNNEGIIGVLPLNNFHGISPPYRVEPEYSHLAFRLKTYIADEIVRGNQLVYIRFKRTDLLPKYKLSIINTELSYFSDNNIHIDSYPWEIKQETETRRVGFGYVFDANFMLKQVLTQTSNLNIYHDLLKKEDINITLEELVNIYKENVFRWEPESETWVPVNSSTPD